MKKREKVKVIDITSNMVIGFKNLSKCTKGYIVFTGSNTFSNIEVKDSNSFPNCSYGHGKENKFKSQKEAAVYLVNTWNDWRFEFYKFKNIKLLHKWLAK